MKLKIHALDGTVHEVEVESLASVSITVETKNAATQVTSIVDVPLVSENPHFVAWVADQMGFDTDTCEGEDDLKQVIIYTGVHFEEGDEGAPEEEE